MNDYRTFWDVPMERAPAKTGAEGQMNCADLRDVFEQLGVDLLDLSTLTVTDVGCGTGRLAQLCGTYHGYDIAPGMVAYATWLGVNAELIEGPDDVVAPCDVLCCLSVFTHIGREERNRYLARFRTLTRWLIVDILPGQDGGSFAAWHADPDRFEQDLTAAGFTAATSYERVSADGATHLYYLAEAK